MNGIYEIARGRGRRGRANAQTPRRCSTPAGAGAAQDAYKDLQAKDSEQDKQTANCLPPGMPAIMSQPYPIQVLLTPGEVTVIQEAYTQVRHIHTDGRKPLRGSDLTFNGTSIGHWEGGTLVVETFGFAPDAILQDGVQHSPKEHMTERFPAVPVPTPWRSAPGRGPWRPGPAAGSSSAATRPAP